jgi:hypothetical protein
MSESLKQNVPDQPVGAETAPTPEPVADNSAASDGSAGDRRFVKDVRFDETTGKLVVEYASF